ncbi:Odorant receptor coreceptor [Gryllus bimaculatus]|nr:Odorant receptor coreceptor [Gryllus bimaculatus]
MRRLVVLVCAATAASILAWTVLTLVDDSTKEVPHPDNGNETVFVDIPRLPLRAWYPWDASGGVTYIGTFVYQVGALPHGQTAQASQLGKSHSTSSGYSWLSCRDEANEGYRRCKPQSRRKESLLTVLAGTGAVPRQPARRAVLLLAHLRVRAAGAPQGRDAAAHGAERRPRHRHVEGSVTIRSIYSNQRDFSGFQRGGGGVGPNGLSKKQEVLVRSAIKFVGNIGDAYGSALLLHMLTSTVTLTLLAYQATKISAVDVYACSVLGYLGYTLAQVFLFCVFGNRLIEESSSVMEAAYSCHWYDGSEEAKTFVQIVCQQCQKSLSISGAKFFTVSLDLFASVLGAVVTYFMVLVQLK